MGREEGPTGQFPPSPPVEIVEDETGYLLIRYAADGEYAGDSWFASIDEAKRQAEWEFGIDPATGWWDGES